MLCCFPHLSIPFSAIIIEASSSIIWERKQRSTTKCYSENERLWNTKLYLQCLHQIPLLRDQGSPWKMRQKEWKSQKEWQTPRKQDSLSQQDEHTFEFMQTEPVCFGSMQIRTRWGLRTGMS